jgi:hypothetical protein
MTTQISLSAGEIQELSESVARLAEALARNERRQARMLRWAILAGLLLLLLTGYFLLERAGIAHAQDPAGFPKACHATSPAPPYR